MKPIRILGASAALALVALSAVAGAALDRAHERGAAVAVADQAAAVERGFATGTAALLSDADDLAVRAVSGATGANAPSGFVDSTVVTPLGERRLSSRGGLAPLADPLATPELLAALDIARDTATVVSSAPIDAGGGSLTVVVVPVYRGPGDVLTRSAGPTVPERRDRIAHWWVGSIDMDELVDAALAPAGRSEPADLAMQVTDGAAVLAGRGTPTFATREVTVAAPPRSWTLAVGAISGPGTPGTVWIVVAVGLALAAAVVTLSWWSERSRQQTVAAHRDVESQLALITEIGPVVQQSLELADVLPAVALRLMDDLGLAGVACALVGDQGEPVDLFAVGTPVARDTRVRLTVPDRIEPGQTFALSLQRGGRSVGVLRIHADRSLDGPELRSLSAVADLATAAIINARLFEQQQEAVGRLRMVDDLKTVFLGTASHELRTPVTAIVGFAQLLNQGWDGFTDEQRREYTERIARNAHALDRLVQDLLDFARLERGGLSISSEPVDLSTVVPQVVRGIEAAHRDHSLEVAVDAGAVVLGDRSGIERIVTNLVSNATKYSPPGSTVWVTVRHAPEAVELRVDDEGPGVAPADRERIFSRFFRGAGEEVVRTRGAGIGLSVVREFVDQMDAEITVGESPSGGARFLVRFHPLDRDAAVGPATDPARMTQGGGARVPGA